MGHVSAASTFRTAHDFHFAVDMLSPRMAAAPFGFVAAHCLELALKSYLMKSAGMTEQAMRKELGHDIEKAWSRCVTAGLGPDAALPTWVVFGFAALAAPQSSRFPGPIGPRSHSKLCIDATKSASRRRNAHT